MLAVGVAYGAALSSPFIFDDYGAIVENRAILSLWPTRELWGPAQSPLAGRPVVALSMALNYSAGGLNPLGYRLMNLALHCLTGWALGLILMHTLQQSPMSSFSNRARPLAWLIALAWVLHPLQTDSVTYITQRTELLMSLFYVTTVYCALQAVSNDRWRAGWQAAAVASCALGMASKEVMVSAPLMVVLYDRAFHFGSWRQCFGKRGRFYTALAGTWIVLIVLMSASPRKMSVGFDAGFSVWEYLSTQCWVLLRYLQMVFWPAGQCLDYGVWVARWPSEVVPGGVVIITLIAGTLMAWFRCPPLGFAGAWFFCILAPTSSFVPITTEVAAERRMYLPLAAVLAVTCLLVDALLRAGVQRWKWPSTAVRRLSLGLAASWLVLLGGATIARNRIYDSEVSAWQSVVESRPLNARAWTNLGRAHQTQGNAASAIDCYRTALQTDPQHISAVFHLGSALPPETADTEVSEHLRRLLDHNPDHVLGLVHLGDLLCKQNRADEAIPLFRRALQVNPQSATTHNSLAGALASQGDFRGALRHAHEAAQLAPDNASVHANLAWLLIMQGEPSLARRHLEQALRIDPHFAPAEQIRILLRQTSGNR